MKKTILVILMITICFSCVFAAEEEKITYDYIDFAYQPTFTRYNAMGQSGLAAPGRLDTFYTNPAALAQKRFGLSVPTVAVTLYNVQKLISDPEAMQTFNSLIDGSADDNASLSLAEKMVKNLGSGYNTLATIDGGIGTTFSILGLGTNFQVKLHTYAKGSSNLANVTIIPEVNVAQTVAFGFNVIKTDALKLQVGVAGHFVYKAYLQGQGANTLSSALSGENSDITQQLLWKTPVMGGYAIPIDAGVTLSIANDAVRFSVTANNLNGVYKMKSYSNVGTMVNGIFGEGTMVAEGDTSEVKDSVEFEIETPWTLNFGFAFAPDIIFHPVITADLIDMLGMIQNFSSDTFRASDLLLHLNAGVEVSLLKVLSLRAGVNRGYMSVGAGLGILGMRVDATYGWQEFGTELGDKPVDSFTIRFNLGYDK